MQDVNASGTHKNEPLELLPPPSLENGGSHISCFNRKEEYQHMEGMENPTGRGDKHSTCELLHGIGERRRWPNLRLRSLAIGKSTTSFF